MKNIYKKNKKTNSKYKYNKQVVLTTCPLKKCCDANFGANIPPRPTPPRSVIVTRPRRQRPARQKYDK